MDRWTIKQLKEISNIDFAIAILNERKMKICPYSPLGVKLSDTIQSLVYIKKIQEIKNDNSKRSN